MGKRVKIDSDRNCSHCLFYRGVDKAPDGSVICGTCNKEHIPNLIKYHGVLCEDFLEDPKNPIPRRRLTEVELEARKQLRRSRRLRGDKVKTSLKAYRKEDYPPLNVKSPLIKSKKKQARLRQIISETGEIKALMDQLFSLPKRSCKEGRQIRKKLRELNFYLSRKHEPITIKRRLPEKPSEPPKSADHVMELTQRRKREFTRAGIVHINKQLLRQCAYYPRPRGPNSPSPCTECSFNLPNLDCQRGHILIDTRIERR